jgi:putative ABC transport system substrate-binding protein
MFYGSDDPSDAVRFRRISHWSPMVVKSTVIRLGTAAALLLLAAPLAADAQQAGKVYRIGYLNPNPAPSVSTRPFRTPAFTERLRDLGWIEGQNITLEYRFGERDEGKLRNAALELVRLSVDVIVAISSSSLQAARTATATIPIVAIDLETDPVASGLAKSIARPGKNVTGLFLDLPELNGKRLQLLREVVPGLTRVAVLWDPSLDPAPLKAAEAAARTVNVLLQPVSVRRPADFDQALRAATAQRAGAIMVIQSPMLDVHDRDIAGLAAQRRLPSIALFRRFTESGGLVSYGPDLNALFEQAAHYVDRILKGAKPGDLPIERPARFELVINMKTAKALGLTIPPSLLLRADQIIE